MIHSMTGFARKEFKGAWGSAVWEIRSVNQRYLETYLRLPEQLRGLEPILRERFRKQLERGKVECNLRFESQTANAQIHVNEALAEQLIDNALWVIDRAGQGQRRGRQPVRGNPRAQRLAHPPDPTLAGARHRNDQKSGTGHALYARRKPV